MLRLMVLGLLMACWPGPDVRAATLEGVTFPAPARPERMLEFLYGPRWRMPDPSFRYDDPVDGVRRLDGWLRGFRSEQPRNTAWASVEIIKQKNQVFAIQQKEERKPPFALAFCFAMR